MKKLLNILLSVLLVMSVTNVPAYSAKVDEYDDNKSSLEEPEDLYYPGMDKDLSEDNKDLLPKEEKAPEYAKGEIILKINPDSPLGSVFGTLLNNKQSFNTIIGPNKLDTFFSEYPAEATRIYSGFPDVITPNKGTISKADAEDIMYEAKEAYNKKIQRIRIKFPPRNNRAPNTSENITYLWNTYKIVFQDEALDVISLSKELAAYKDIFQYVELNYLMELYFEPNDPYYDSEGSWDQDYDNLYALKEDKLDCDPAWDIATGEGIVVAVIDTGVDYNHEDLADNIWENPDEIPDNNQDDDDNGFVDDWRGYDFSDNDNDPSDYYGHGTHCAGTIAAIGNNEIGVIGVAPDAQIMPVKMFPNSYEDVAARCIQYAADMGADVLSNSWGPSERLPSSPVLEEVVDYAYDLGCIVVFAAGNDNDDVGYYSPANYSKTIAVAATDANDERAEFSQWGTLIDVSAPGVGVLSLRAEETDMYGDGEHIVDDDYYWANGTSMACPHVAGLSALILSNNPDFTYEEVKGILRASADDLGDEGPDSYYGHGRINANEALQIESVCIAQIDSPQFGRYYPDELGVVRIIGTALGEDFQSYRLKYRDITDENGDWIQIDEGRYEVINDALGEWDMRELEYGGIFSLRLSVIDIDDNVFEDIISPFIIPQSISTLRELQDMELNGDYCLVNDIDASNTRNWNDGAGFNPIGDMDNPFTGIFDGNGYVITRLYINRLEEDNVGLFKYTSCDIIQNVGLVDVSITGSRNVGGLVGSNGSYGGTSHKINCYVTGEVTGNYYVGGLVGFSMKTRVTNCYVIGEVNGERCVGGLVGKNQDMSFIINSYAAGSVTGESYIGGLVGDSYLPFSITNSYATGTVTGSSYVGGLVGQVMWGSITNSYATGSVTGGSYIGGLVGLNFQGYYVSNYWDTETSGLNVATGAGNIDGITGKTTLQMMQQRTFIGWDFDNTWFMLHCPQLQENTRYILTRLFVDPSARDINNGFTWDNAYTSLQDALNATRDVDAPTEIWVKEGTYKPTNGNDREVSFELNPLVHVYGGFNGTEVTRDQRDCLRYPTILSGDVGRRDDNRDNSYHVVTGTYSAVLDGFIVTGGNANHADRNADNPYQYGGGMYNYQADPIVKNCVFTDNYARCGAGMANIDSTSEIINCVFTQNSSEDNGGGVANLEGSVPYLYNCTFTLNHARGSGGGGMYNVNSSPVVTNTIFWGNTVYNPRRGGLQIYNVGQGGRSNSSFDYCDIEGGQGGIRNSNASVRYGHYNIDDDPLFVNANDPDGRDNQFITLDDGLKLGRRSPCIDVGIEEGLSYLKDILGINHYGESPDIGAYEYKPPRRGGGRPHDKERVD